LNQAIIKQGDNRKMSLIKRKDVWTDPLGKELSRMSVQVNDAFIHNGRIVPIAFRSGDEMTVKDPDVKAEKFRSLPTAVLEHNAQETIPQVTNKRVAVFFSGGPASGGYNVLAGIQQTLQGCTLIGALGGPDGFLAGDFIEITPSNLKKIFNRGGFGFLKTGRGKFDSPEKFKQARRIVQEHRLDAIIVIGGDDSNTNAAELAEELKDTDCTVVGVPKTIDGDVAIESVLPISFGFATATATFAATVGALLPDAYSQTKYWFFVKLMGRDASNIALEVALQTQPHLALISEEIAAKGMSLNQVVMNMVEVIANRAVGRYSDGEAKNYGVALIPEGVIGFIPEINTLIEEINVIIASKSYSDLPDGKHYNYIMTHLTPESETLYASFPESVKNALLLDRDPHANLKVSLIPTEILLLERVKQRIKEMQNPNNETIYFGKEDGQLNYNPDQIAIFRSFKLSAQTKFLGYEGRSCNPNRFDGGFSFNLGATAGSLVMGNHTGYMAGFTDLASGGKPIGIPLASQIVREIRKGKPTAVISKSLVDLNRPPFQAFKQLRTTWQTTGQSFINPGPIQYWGDFGKSIPITVALKQGYVSVADYINHGITAIPHFNMGTSMYIEFEG